MADNTELLAWGWVLLASGCTALLIFAYRSVWVERYRRPAGLGRGSLRIRGKVVAPRNNVVYCLNEFGEELVARPFTVEVRGGERVTVVPNGAMLRGPGYRHPRGSVRGILGGDCITVDGIQATVLAEGKLYREPGQAPAVDAVRIVAGRWPELPWLKLPLAVSSVVFVISLLRVIHAPPNLQVLPDDDMLSPIASAWDPGVVDLDLRHPTVAWDEVNDVLPPAALYPSRGCCQHLLGGSLTDPGAQGTDDPIDDADPAPGFWSASPSPDGALEVRLQNNPPLTFGYRTCD